MTGEKKDPVKIMVNNPSVENIPDWMIIGATRYAMGRMTYIVQDTCDWLVLNWERLPNTVTSIISRDLEEAFEQDDRAREKDTELLSEAVCSRPLGWNCDRAQWERVRALYQVKAPILP